MMIFLECSKSRIMTKPDPRRLNGRTVPSVSQKLAMGYLPDALGENG